MSTPQHATTTHPDAAEVIAADVARSEGPGSAQRVRNGLLAIVAVGLLSIVFFWSYSSAFGNPTLRHISLSVAAPAPLVSQLEKQKGLLIDEVNSAGAARTAVENRTDPGAIDISPANKVTTYIADGGGVSTAKIVTGIGDTIAARLHTTPTTIDVAPLGDKDPNGTVEFYAVVFIALCSSLGATILGRVFGTVRDPMTLIERTLFLVVMAIVLATIITVFADFVLHATPQQPWAEFGVLALTSLCIGGAATGVGAAFGTVAALALTLTLTALGNTSAGGPIGEPLLHGVFAVVNPIVPQGAAITMMRSVLYFNGNGMVSAILCIVAWGAAGIFLAFVAMYLRHLKSSDEASRPPRQVNVEHPNGAGHNAPQLDRNIPAHATMIEP